MQHDLAGTLLSINSYGAQSLGRTLEDMVGHSVVEFIPEERRRGVSIYLRKIAETGEAHPHGLYLELLAAAGALSTFAPGADGAPRETKSASMTHSAKPLVPRTAAT